MRITKLEKEKSLLMKKILQIQHLVARERKLIGSNNVGIKILDEDVTG